MLGGDPVHQTILPIHGVTGFDLDDAITVGAVIDAETAGHCLGWWSWSPTAIGLPATFPQIDVIVLFSHLVTLTVNSTTATGRTAEIDIPRNAAIGSVNGNPITAGCRLLISNGRIVARATVPAKKPVPV